MRLKASPEIPFAPYHFHATQPMPPTIAKGIIHLKNLRMCRIFFLLQIRKKRHLIKERIFGLLMIKDQSSFKGERQYYLIATMLRVMFQLQTKAWHDKTEESPIKDFPRASFRAPVWGSFA